MDFLGGVGYTNIDLIYSDMDHLPGIGEEVFSKKFEMHLGGGVPATLINTNRLGVPSKILTFIGTDIFSGFASESFAKYGSEVINLYQGGGMPITLSTVMVCNQDRSFISYGSRIAEGERMNEAIYHHLSGAKIVDMHIGFLDTYRRLKEEGTVLVFDTGWEDDLSIDKYEEYLTLADYYLPNQKEALKITRTQTVEAAAEKLLPYFHDVIIKLDKDGCLLRNERGTQLIPAMKNITTVDSTGAGDAFMSGFLYGLYYDYPIEQCLRFGNVTGGVCVQGVGCLTKYVHETDLLRLAKTL